MAQFDPPQRHWDDDFDRRLASTFEWLREQVEELRAEVRVLTERDSARDDKLRQAVADAKYWAEKAGAK